MAGVWETASRGRSRASHLQVAGLRLGLVCLSLAWVLWPAIEGELGPIAGGSYGAGGGKLLGVWGLSGLAVAGLMSVVRSKWAVRLLSLLLLATCAPSALILLFGVACLSDCRVTPALYLCAVGLIGLAYLTLLDWLPWSDGLGDPPNESGRARRTLPR